MRKSKKRLRSGNTGTQTNESDKARNRREKKFVKIAVAFVLAFCILLAAFCHIRFDYYDYIVQRKEIRIDAGCIKRKIPCFTGFAQLLNQSIFVFQVRH